MKRKLFAIIGIIAIVSTIFASCNSKDNKQITSTTLDNYDANVNEYILEDKEVTDENGEVVTDENGNAVTEKVVVKVTGNSDSNDNEESTTNVDNQNTSSNSDADTNSITNETPSVTINNNGYEDNNDVEIGILTTEEKVSQEPTTVKPVENPTSPEVTTIPADKNVVPLTSDTGKKIDFSPEDQQIIKQMLEVPYLYESSYENADGVPINIASHTAIWLMQRENISSNMFPKDTIILSLFKYYGQTVINYANRCNSESSNNNIMFVKEKDPNSDEYNSFFLINQIEKSTHTISIDHFEDLGNNNYYKVVAKVKGADGIKNVDAVIQRNKLDPSLGFSIKALKWS